MSNLQSFAQSKFIGLNKDLSPEKLPPGCFAELVNKKVMEDGTVGNVNGCSLVKDISANVGAMDFYQTRGEDFVLLWNTDNNKILVYTWENDTLTAYNKWNSSNEIEVDGTDLEMEEEPWFVEHSNEFYFGNISKGIYRFRPGHQNIMSGAAPLDIIAEPEVEGDVEKDYTNWRLAYDYEYKGGRSPLSRWAGVRLYSPKQQIKITMDTPPDISKNRRIYAKCNTGSDDDPSWSDWYYIEEIDDADTTTVTLDEKLSTRIEDEYKYTEDIIKGISPKARMGIAHEGRICLAYLVESPSIVQLSRVGQPYYDTEYQFDLGEAVTNMISVGEFIIDSTDNNIFLLKVASNRQEILFKEGAYRNSMQFIGGYVYWLNEKGFRRWDGQSAQPEEVPGLNTVDFSGLQKEKRYHIWTSQQDFEKGSYSGGVSSGYIFGALCLQPNLYLLSGMKGIIEGQWSGIGADSREGTCPESGKETFHSQLFQIKGDSDDSFTATKLHLWMKAVGTDGWDCENNEYCFSGYITEDDSDNPGHPDMSVDAQLAEFSGAVHGETSYDRIFELSKAITFDADTTYHIVIPPVGKYGQDWQMYTREWNPSEGENPLYPEGEWFRYSQDGGASWSNVEKDNHTTILRFAFEGYGSRILLSPLHWLTTYGETSLNSKDYDYAQDITPNITCTLQGIEIAVKDEVPSEEPTITIESDSDGEPSGSVLSTATSPSGGSANPGQHIIRADLGGEEISADTRIWVRVHATSAAEYNYLQTDSKGNTIGKRSDDDGSTWTSVDDILWCKLYISPASKPNWATDGIWESEEVDIGDDNNFEMLHANLSQPTDAGIKIELRGYDQSDSSWGDYTTLYDTTGANSDDNLPYDIETNMDTDIKKIQTKVTLELSTAEYTPIVDSILATFKKNGDSGDRLHSGNVKGDYYLSVEDYDSDSSDEFSYVFTRKGGWHELSEPFFGYLPIGDDICFGVGKNTNESYRNIYKLDDSSVNVWYSGDSSSVDIDTELKTGKILWSNYPKYFRKVYLDLSAVSDSTLRLDINTGNIELDADDITLSNHSKRFTIEDCSIPEHIYISLPRKMKGRWVEIGIKDEGGDYALHGYEILHKPKRYQNISIPNSTVVVIHASTTTFEEAYNDYYYKNYLYVCSRECDDNYPYLGKYSIGIDGDLTLESSHKLTALHNDRVYQIWITDDYIYLGYSDGLAIYDSDFSFVGETNEYENLGGLIISANEEYGWGCSGYESNKRLYYYDLSDKSNPDQVIVNSDLYFTQIAKYKDYLFVASEYGTGGKISVFDISSPGAGSYTIVKNVDISETDRVYSLLADKNSKTLYYGGANYVGIINISDPENPSVVLENSNNSIARTFLAQKDKYLFGLNGTIDKVIVTYMSDYRSVETESELSYSLGTSNPRKNLSIDEKRNLLFYSSRDGDGTIEVFKIYGI